MVDRVEINSEEADASQDTNNEQPSTDRPEWLPEKFANPEAMAAAYAELEQKQSAEDAPVPEETSNRLTQDSLMKYSEKYFAEGLDENDYKELDALGISKELIGQYAAGMSALHTQQTAQVYSQVGGEENYTQMVNWATDNLAENEVVAFNSAVESNDVNTVLMAVKGLHARYAEATGNEASLVQGSTAGSGVGRYESVKQVTDAINDPRYDKDPAYRAEVAKKLEHSQLN